MAIQPVLRLGDPRLLQTASKVQAFNTPELDQLIEDMLDTMHAEDGAGLAAPQIGIGLRVVVFGFEANSRYPEAETVPQTLLINPVITPIISDNNASGTEDAMVDDMEDGWEGCLSVPGMRGVVSRYKQIKYRGLSPDGEVIEVLAKDFHARVVQHECDHLDGIIYTHRLTQPQLFGFNEELALAENNMAESNNVAKNNMNKQSD
jgi:peptide deformylase